MYNAHSVFEFCLGDARKMRTPLHPPKKSAPNEHNIEYATFRYDTREMKNSLNTNLVDCNGPH